MSSSLLNDCRVLVIGGGGFLGQHVVHALCHEGATVSALDIAAPSLADPRVAWSIGSVQDEVLLSSLVNGCDSVIYLAGASLPATGNSDIAAEVASNVVPVIKAAEICDRMGVRRFVFASSGGTVYGHSSKHPIREDSKTTPKNAYGASKLACEHYLRVLADLHQITAISLRIANPYGEGQTARRGQGFIAAVLERLSKNETLDIWGDGSVIRDFVYVGDVAQAFVRACAYNGPSEGFNVGAGVGHSLRDVICLAEQETGRTLRVNFLKSRPVDVASNVLDITRAKRLLHWTPSVSLQSGLQRTVLSLDVFCSSRNPESGAMQGFVSVS